MDNGFKATHTIGEGGPECRCPYPDHALPGVELANGAVFYIARDWLVPIQPPPPEVEPEVVTVREWCSSRHKYPYWDSHKNGRHCAHLLTGRTHTFLAGAPSIEELAGMGLYVVADRWHMADGYKHGWCFSDIHPFDDDDDNTSGNLTEPKETVNAAILAAVDWLRENEPQKLREWKAERDKGATG